MDWDALREEFPITRNYNFQNHAAVGPLSRRAADAVRQYVKHAEENSYLRGGFYKHADRVRALAASLVNANADEITFSKNTSEGISFVANGLSWQSGDNEVTANVEFPANMYPWHRGFYHREWGSPLALVVPPTASYQTKWGWGVGNTTVTPLYHQFRRAWPGIIIR